MEPGTVALVLGLAALAGVFLLERHVNRFIKATDERLRQIEVNLRDQ